MGIQVTEGKRHFGALPLLCINSISVSSWLSPRNLNPEQIDTNFFQLCKIIYLSWQFKNAKPFKLNLHEISVLFPYYIIDITRNGSIQLKPNEYHQVFLAYFSNYLLRYLSRGEGKRWRGERWGENADNCNWTTIK